MEERKNSNNNSCSGNDKPSSCDCVYWGLSVFNLLFLLKLQHLQLHLNIWYSMYSHNNHFFSLLSIASFNQPFKITVHLPPHTRLYKSLQSSIVKKTKKKTTNRDHTIIEYRVHKHTLARICMYPNVYT